MRSYTANHNNAQYRIDPAWLFGVLALQVSRLPCRACEKYGKNYGKIFMEIGTKY